MVPAPAQPPLKLGRRNSWLAYFDSLPSRLQHGPPPHATLSLHPLHLILALSPGNPNLTSNFRCESLSSYTTPLHCTAPHCPEHYCTQPIFRPKSASQNRTRYASPVVLAVTPPGLCARKLGLVFIPRVPDQVGRPTCMPMCCGRGRLQQQAASSKAQAHHRLVLRQSPILQCDLP